MLEGKQKKKKMSLGSTFTSSFDQMFQLWDFVILEVRSDGRFCQLKPENKKNN